MTSSSCITRPARSDLLARVPAQLTAEANKSYRLWLQRHPDFEARGGRVHIVAHSLGSALTSEILSNQPTTLPSIASMPKQVCLSLLPCRRVDPDAWDDEQGAV